MSTQTLMISVNPRIGENESASYLEIHKFSDPSLYLYFDQCNISDRLVYNMYRFGVKNFPLLPRGLQNGFKSKIRHYGKLTMSQKTAPTFLDSLRPLLSGSGTKKTIHIRSNGT